MKSEEEVALPKRERKGMRGGGGLFALQAS